MFIVPEIKKVVRKLTVSATPQGTLFSRGNNKFYAEKYISSNLHTVNQIISPIQWDVYV